MFGFSCIKSEKNEPGRGSGLSKKQQAIANRELELIELAIGIIREQGFGALTMDKLTAASPYSKGTIYNHFCSKEDAILAVCVNSLRRESQLFERAASFEGSSRERIIAMHVAFRIYARMEPVLSTCAIMAKSPWVIEKASPERINYLNQLEELVIQGADDLVSAAVQEGDLRFTPGISSDAIVFANWSIAFGSNALTQNASNSRCISRLQDPFTVLHNANMLLDGLGWKPLSSEWDYRKTWQKVEHTLFKDELTYLESVGR